MASVPTIVVEYPVMSDGSLDYLYGNSYKVIPIESRSEGILRIQHRLEGRNLVRELIEKGKAAFSCAIISTWSSYRDVVIVDAKTVQETENLLVAEQELRSETLLYSSPASFQPQVIATDVVSEIKLISSHAVDEILIGHTVSIPKAARIAYAPYFRMESLSQSILRIKQEESLPKGCFEVFGIPESGFYFLIKMSEDMFRWVKNPGLAHKHRQSIFCFALSQGLAILHNEYRNPESWRGFSNLNFLHSHLKSIGAPLWGDDEFSPNKAVAHWLPHEFDSIEDFEYGE